MTRNALLGLMIRRATLEAAAKDARERRDTRAIHSAETELRRVVTEIMRMQNG